MWSTATSKSWTQILDPDPGPGPWKTWAQKNLDHEKPGPWKTSTLKNLDSEKPGLWKKLLTVNAKSSAIDLWLDSKYVSEGFLISVWFLLFHHTLLKEPLEVDLKWNHLKWNWLLFKNSFGWSKGLLYKKKDKNPFQQMSLINFSLILKI